MQVLVTTDPSSCPRFCRPFSPLALAIHWPSMISEDQQSVANFLEATSFFTMQQRADSVGRHAGYSLLRLMVEQQTSGHPFRFNLIGHSFGCRVLLSALEALAEDPSTTEKAKQNAFSVVLIQAAADTDSLVPRQLYGSVQQNIPNLRMLVTTSQNDKACGTWYPAAQKLAHLFSGPVDAMGAVGPTGSLSVPVDERYPVSTTSVPAFKKQFGVADLTPLHKATADAYGAGGNWGGQHSDINLPQIYELLAKFLGH
jgi:hypothetical protein